MRKSFKARRIGIVAIGMVIFVSAIALTNPTLFTRFPNTESAQITGPAFTDREGPLDLKQTWIVSASEATTLIYRGATLLDARANPWAGLHRLPGRIPVSWQDFSPTQIVRKGNLLDSDTILAQKLQKLGISNDRPVVVFADPQNGWGEDGRLVWMLRTLGHQQAVMVDGGHRALLATSLEPKLNQPQGNFVIQRDTNWQIQRENLKTVLSQPNWAMIDTRTPQEYAGSTPHGEQRQGHLPGAVNLHFRSLLNSQGKLLPRDQILARLQEMGITKDTQIVAYCTGGIRSAWLTAVLADMDFQVKNYAGSMWEWSAGKAQEYPLVVKP